jgi:hypothetical protein
MPSVVTGIIGGFQGSSAAHNAANAAGAGYLAAGNMVGTATGQAVNQYGESANQAENYTLGAAGTAGAGATAAAGTGIAGLNPYSTVGSTAASQLNAGLAPGGNLTGNFTAADMSANDPGYQFRLNTGEQAVQRSLAASGISGGGAAKALNDYAQGAASSEYNNAFNQYMTNRQANFSNLATGAGLGETASTTQAGLGLNAAEYAGSTGLAGATSAANAAEWGGGNQAATTMAGAEYEGNALIGKGNATAAGDVGAANAWNGMLGSIGTAANGVLAGGFGGGGGFSLGGALSGIPQLGGGGGGSPIALPMTSGLPSAYENGAINLGSLGGY